MAETPEEKAAEDSRLATAVAKGLEMFETSKAERDAKAAAEKGGDKVDDTTPAKKSIAERLLGI